MKTHTRNHKDPHLWLWVHVSTGTGASCQKKLQGYLRQSRYVLSSHYKGSISLNPAETKADTKPELIKVEWLQNFKKKKIKAESMAFFGNF